MKTSLFVFACITFFACKPENTTPTKPATSSSSFDATKATLLKSGMFVGVDGPTTGTVNVYDQNGTKYIVLDPFQSHSGPDLKVYLSKDVKAEDYLRIDKLQSIMGRQVYAVPGKPSINDYNYVHIWCEAFSVEFARAEIK